MSNSDNANGHSGELIPNPATSPPGANGAVPAVIPVIPHPLALRGTAPPPMLSATPNVGALLKALRRRWLLASVLGILAALATAGGVWFFLPAGKYTVYAKLYMPMQKDPVLFDLDKNKTDFASFQRTQMAILRGRPVLYAALRDPKVKQLNLEPLTKKLTPVEWLEKELKVEYVDGPELPRLTMTGDDADVPKVLVIAVVDAYLKDVKEREEEKRLDRIDKLKKIQENYLSKVNQLRKKKNDLTKMTGAPTGEVMAVMQSIRERQLADAQSELIRVTADLRRLKLERELYPSRSQPQSRDGAPPPADKPGDGDKLAGGEGGPSTDLLDRAAEAYADNNKDVEAARAVKKRLEKLLADTWKMVPDEENATIKKLKKDIAVQEAAINERRQELWRTRRAQLLEKAQNDAAFQAALLDKQITFNTEFKKILEGEITRLEGGGKQLINGMIALDDDKPQLMQAESGLSLVSAEIDKATIEPAAANRVQQLEKEAVVIAPDETTRRLRAAGLGAAGALAAVLLLVSFLEFRSRRLDSADELVRGLGLELMGTLPAAPRRFGGSLMRTTAADTAVWQSLLAESVDSARTLLLRSTGHSKIRVVMITSASSGEGKTSLATHLAASLARAGRKTLLLDGDMRKPAAHRIFDLPAGPGLCEILRGEVEVSAAVRPIPEAGLAVLPAGEYDAEAIRRLAHDGIGPLIEALKQEYEFIVIDSSPVLPVADALLFAQHTDGVLLSLFHEVSRLPKVYAACQRLSLMGVPILGVVVNGTHEDAHGYGQTYAKAAAQTA